MLVLHNLICFTELANVKLKVNNFDKNKGWVGIGFTDSGKISDGSGDFCVLWKDNAGKTTVSDVHIKPNTSRFYLDQQQDCTDFELKYIGDNETIEWSFQRKFVTCDPNDYGIEVHKTYKTTLNFLSHTYKIHYFLLYYRTEPHLSIGLSVAIGS